MISVANRIYVNPDYNEAFEERFRDRAGLVDDMDGFISYQLMRPLQPNAPYVVLTFWESREAFNAWVSSDSFKKGHARSSTLPKEAFRDGGSIEIHQEIMSSSS
ncbi:MAG: antibiotic biosynthesis monooxygenase family protein [Ardenticatenaceae bacterium]